MVNYYKRIKGSKKNHKSVSDEVAEIKSVVARVIRQIGKECAARVRQKEAEPFHAINKSLDQIITQIEKRKTYSIFSRHPIREKIKKGYKKLFPCPSNASFYCVERRVKLPKR